MTERLKGVIVERRPTIEVIAQHDQSDALHYVDPPYLHSSRKKNQQSNYLHEMTDADHVELASFLKSLKGMVVISGYKSDLYEKLYGEWESREKVAFSDGAKPRTEVLWINHQAVEAQRNLF